MSRETFLNALRVADGGYITIGGGEPTMWRDLMWGIKQALDNRWIEAVHVITNGKKTDMVWTMIGLQSVLSQERFSVAMSDDEFHEDVDYHVREWFKKNGGLHGGGFVHDSLRYQGRAKNLITQTESTDRCICDDLFIKPNGDAFQCGCEDAIKLGNVNAGSLLEYQQGECSKEVLKVTEALKVVLEDLVEA